jgi:hypothetical protein
MLKANFQVATGKQKCLPVFGLKGSGLIHYKEQM